MGEPQGETRGMPKAKDMNPTERSGARESSYENSGTASDHTPNTWKGP